MSRATAQAYENIRERILTGTLAPGAKLKEEELALLCGVSRTPVREALRRLEAEMLVRRTDSQRTYVAEWSLDDVDEVFVLRGMLEGHAAARAARRITADQLARLHHINDAIGAAIRGPVADVQAFLAQNAAFHAVILDAAGSARLSAMLGGLIEQPIVRQTALRYSIAELSRSHAEHGELIAALEKRDSDWARAVMTGHIRRAFHTYAESWRAPARPGPESASQQAA